VLHRLQLALGIQALDVRLDGGDLTLRLARAQLADGLSLE